MDLKKYFQKSDLIPAIIKEAGTNEVLMLAYMNEESMKKTLETGYTWFYSRSRQELWNKGATSGHVQKVLSIVGDCDDDTLLITVEQTDARKIRKRDLIPAIYLKKVSIKSSKNAPKKQVKSSSPPRIRSRKRMWKMRSAIFFIT